jgi:enoyl-CoA hydratase/carnithine racemase
MFPKQAMRMLLTGEEFSAAQALEMGLISHVARTDLEVFTRDLAARIAMAASSTLLVGKRGVYGQAEMGVKEAYDFAGKVMADSFVMEDAKQGVTAFLEKRQPTWS